jgi:hypothetical protein
MKRLILVIEPANLLSRAAGPDRTVRREANSGRIG